MCSGSVFSASDRYTGVPNLWLFERASERILVTWTTSRGGIVLIVITEDGTTRCRSFADPAAFAEHQQAMQGTLEASGWVRTERHPGPVSGPGLRGQVKGRQRTTNKGTADPIYRDQL